MERGEGRKDAPAYVLSSTTEKTGRGGGDNVQHPPKKAVPMYCVALSPPSAHGATVQLAADSLSLCLIPSPSRREADGRGIFHGGIHDAQL